jgi:hypothetical protein
LENGKINSTLSTACWIFGKNGKIDIFGVILNFIVGTHFNGALQFFCIFMPRLNSPHYLNTVRSKVELSISSSGQREADRLRITYFLRADRRPELQPPPLSWKWR